MGMMSEEERGAEAPKEAARENGMSEEKGSELREGTLIVRKPRPKLVAVNPKPTDKEGLMIQEEKTGWKLPVKRKKRQRTPIFRPRWI